MPYYAHSLKERPPEEWEPLEDHLRAVASLAGGFAKAFGAEDWGKALGLWHDLGKYSAEFQRYIGASHANSGDDAHELETSGRVDHSTAGAVHASSLGQLGRLLAYGIAGHHAGLPNNVGGESSLTSRLERASTPERMAVFGSVPKELLDCRPLVPPRLKTEGNRQRLAFGIGFFARMLFSCLVDADFLATETFMDPDRSASRPKPIDSLKPLRDRLDSYLHEKATAAPPTTVNRQRQDVLAACRTKAMLPPGLFSLNVPTGGGKTLSSLAFALSHAVEHDLNRVVYAIPFTSIIEQTADVFRTALGDLEQEVLEHHSNLDPDNPKQHPTRSRLAAENWDSRIVVTTNVQLFESLFASRTSRSRKLHRLARSVIVLDEAQTLPPSLLAPTLAALDELVRNYGATVVLCTATQPAIEHRETFSIGLKNVTPIIDEPRKLHESLRRTNVQTNGITPDEELINQIRHDRQALCIVNSRNHAAALFRELDDADVFHLSANLCAAHRSDIVAKIRKRLAAMKPCRVISTQVIEAGVDVDFPVVYRAAAGLDSVAQAAGRCNREGRLIDNAGEPVLGRVVVFDYDEKVYRTPPFIKHAANHFREVAPDHTGDLLSPEAIEAYFHLHYWQQGRDDGRGWDEGRGKESVMGCFDISGNELHAQFRDAAERFQMIDDATTPILVPYKKGQALIRELENMPNNPEPKQLRGFDRRAQRYVVGVREHGLRKLLERGVLLERHERFYVANANAYQEGLGLTFEAVGLDAELLVQ